MYSTDIPGEDTRQSRDGDTSGVDDTLLGAVSLKHANPSVKEESAIRDLNAQISRELGIDSDLRFIKGEGEIAVREGIILVLQEMAAVRLFEVNGNPLFFHLLRANVELLQLKNLPPLMPADVAEESRFTDAPQMADLFAASLRCIDVDVMALSVSGKVLSEAQGDGEVRFMDGCQRMFGELIPSLWWQFRGCIGDVDELISRLGRFRALACGMSSFAASHPLGEFFRSGFDKAADELDRAAIQSFGSDSQEFRGYTVLSEMLESHFLARLRTEREGVIGPDLAPPSILAEKRRSLQRDVSCDNPRELLNILWHHEDWNPVIASARREIASGLLEDTGKAACNTVLDESMLVWLLEKLKENPGLVTEEDVQLGKSAVRLELERTLHEVSGSTTVNNSFAAYKRSLFLWEGYCYAHGLQGEDAVLVDCGCGECEAIRGFVEEAAGRLLRCQDPSFEVREEGGVKTLEFDGARLRVYGISRREYPHPPYVNFLKGDIYSMDLPQDVDEWWEMYGPTTHGSMKKRMITLVHDCLKIGGTAEILIEGIRFITQEGKEVGAGQFFETMRMAGHDMKFIENSDIGTGVLVMRKTKPALVLPVRLVGLEKIGELCTRNRDLAGDRRLSRLSDTYCSTYEINPEWARHF